MQTYLIELLLQLFIGVVNAKLLETVDFESLKPIYIQHANEPASRQR